MSLLKPFVIIMLSLLFICKSNAQIGEAFNELNEMLAEFDNGKEMIRQEFTVDDDKPYEVTLTRVLTDNKKGKEKEEIFSFNIGLINPKKIERKAKKDEMSILFKTSDGKFIKHTKDGKSKFDNEMKVIAPDIDAARDIEVYFKELIEMGSELWETAIQVPVSTKEINRLISSFGKGMESEKQTIEQSVTINEDMTKGLMQLDRGITKKGKSKIESNQFYWGDLNPKSISFKSNGAYQVMTIKTKDKKKVIASLSDDKLKYESELQLYFTSPSDAIYTSEMMETATTLGKESNEKSFAEFENCGNNCLSLMNETTTSATSSISNVTISEDCQASMEINGKKSEKIEWHWSDIDPSSVDVDYNSKNQTISFKVNKKKKFLTYYNEEGKLSKYDDALEFDIADVFSAKSMLIIIPQIIDQCERDLEVKDMAWMSSYVSSVTVDNNKYEQSIDQTDDECSYIYKLENKEKGKEETYEFNLYDLNPNSVKLEISKNKINLNVVTKGKEKLITKHEEGGDLKYAKEIDMKFDDLLSARIAKNTFKDIIQGCQQ